MVVQQGSEGAVPLERSRVRTSDVLSDNAKSFEDLLLSPALISSLKLSGFTQPSPVQQSAIPLGRIGSDLIVQAKSGTGKTVAFAVICLLRVKAAVTLPQVSWVWCSPEHEKDPCFSLLPTIGCVSANGVPCMSSVGIYAADEEAGMGLDSAPRHKHSQRKDT